jgi:segregation and condensation protein A
MYRLPDIPEEVKKYEEPVDLDALLGDLTLHKLHLIYQDVIRRQVDKVDPIRSKFGKIEKEEVTVEDKIDYVTDYARNHRHFSFRDLLMKQKTKMQTVVTFLAILQLMKDGTIYIEQEQPFEDIMITSKVESENM